MNTNKLYALLYKSFVCKDELQPALTSVAHKNGKLYASDGHILARVELDYPQELEGKAKNKTGEDVHNAVNYESVIPTSDKLTAVAVDLERLKVAVDLERLKVAVAKIKDVKVSIRKKRYPALIEVGGCFYSAEQVKAIFDLFNVAEDDFTLFAHCGGDGLNLLCAQGMLTDTFALTTQRYAYGKGGEGNLKENEVEQLLCLSHTIETALAYAPEVKPKNKTWYEK